MYNEVNKPFFLLFKNLVENSSATVRFFEDLSQQLKYKAIVLETDRAYSLYQLRRDSVERPEIQRSQFDGVLEKLSAFQGDKVITHIIMFRFESYFFFTSEDISEYLGYIVFPNREEVL